MSVDGDGCVSADSDRCAEDDQAGAREIKSKIAGDDVIGAHGSRDMPTWGPLFKQADPSNAVAELRLTNLVKYFEEIQAK